MKTSIKYAAAILAAMLTPCAAGAVTIDFSGDQQFGPVYGQLVLTVSAGQVTGGYAALSGAGLPKEEILGAIAYYSYGGTTGYRSGDGTDAFGGDTAWPIDANGLIFGTNPGSKGGYAFAIWNNGATPSLYGAHYETWLSGPGGFGGFYHDSGANSFTVSVPELSTWAMMLAGFASLGFFRAFSSEADAGSREENA